MSCIFVVLLVWVAGCRTNARAEFQGGGGSLTARSDGSTGDAGTSSRDVHSMPHRALLAVEVGLRAEPNSTATVKNSTPTTAPSRGNGSSSANSSPAASPTPPPTATATPVTLAPSAPTAVTPAPIAITPSPARGTMPPSDANAPKPTCIVTFYLSLSCAGNFNVQSNETSSYCMPLDGFVVQCGDDVNHIGMGCKETCDINRCSAVSRIDYDQCITGTGYSFEMTKTKDTDRWIKIVLSMVAGVCVLLLSLMVLVSWKALKQCMKIFRRRRQKNRLINLESTENLRSIPEEGATKQPGRK